MTTQLAPQNIFRSWDNNGNPLFQGKLYTYAAGTTTPQATYTDSTGGTPNANPVILNTRGEAFVWLDPALSYKFVLEDAQGTLIWTQDNIPATGGALGNFVPVVTDTYTLGTAGASWANAYLGPNNAPVLDSASGNIGYYASTAAEITAGVTPAIFTYAPLDSRRYAFDLTGNAANGVANAALLTAILKAAGLAAAATLQPQEVVLYPGIYCVTRTYINYSNVSLRIMPGASIQSTQTGITNNNTTGQAPAYAIIHINPLSYVNNPFSGAAGTITNVRVYGGGTVQGPYSSTHAYDGFAMGIVSNDCNKCSVEGLILQGCGGENILLNPSAWNTCSDLKISNNEVLQGGEVGINNARAFLIFNNYVHDSWSQNGIGGDGDNGIVGFNRIRNMAGGALTPGGSGAKDIGISRDITYVGNISNVSGASIAGTYAMFCSDDGATTVPKYNHKYIGNTLDNHSGPIAIGCDYNTALNIEIENNIIANCVSPGGTGADFNVVAGSGVYHLRGNTFNPGLTGNNAYGVTVSSAGAPSVVLEESNEISGHATADVNASAAIVLKMEYTLITTLALTGFTAGLNPQVVVCKKQDIVTINFASVNGTSNATTMTLGTLPTYLRPTRSQNFRFPVMDNGTNGDGILQIASTGVMTFFKDINGGAFTNSGTKGITGPYNITYLLI